MKEKTTTLAFSSVFLMKSFNSINFFNLFLLKNQIFFHHRAYENERRGKFLSNKKFSEYTKTWVSVNRMASWKTDSVFLLQSGSFECSLKLKIQLKKFFLLNEFRIKKCEFIDFFFLVLLNLKKCSGKFIKNVWSRFLQKSRGLTTLQYQKILIIVKDSERHK